MIGPIPAIVMGAILCAFANRIRGGMLHLRGDLPGRMIWGLAAGVTVLLAGLPYPWAIAVGVASWLACSAGLRGGESMGLGETTLAHDWLAMTIFTAERMLPGALFILLPSLPVLAPYIGHFAAHTAAWWQAPMIVLGPLAYFSGRWWPFSVPLLEFKAYDGADSAVGEFVWGLVAGPLLVLSVHGF